MATAAIGAVTGAATGVFSLAFGGGGPSPELPVIAATTAARPGSRSDNPGDTDNGAGSIGAGARGAKIAGSPSSLATGRGSAPASRMTGCNDGAGSTGAADKAGKPTGCTTGGIAPGTTGTIRGWSAMSCTFDCGGSGGTGAAGADVPDTS